jgi:hypothetical protein
MPRSRRFCRQVSRGAKRSDLPVQQTTKFDPVINGAAVALPGAVRVLAKPTLIPGPCKNFFDWSAGIVLPPAVLDIRGWL